VNLERLKKDVGRWMELVPPACHLDHLGNSLPEKNEDWRVEEVTDDVVRLSTQSGHQVKLGTDHIQSFATNPQRNSETEDKFGFLKLHVQVFVQGERVYVKPNVRPGERVAVASVVVEDKIVTPDYPTESGIQQRLEAAGFRLQWSLESQLAGRVDLHGWEIVIEPDTKGKLFRFRCKDPRDDQILIKKRISDGAPLSESAEPLPPNAKFKYRGRIFWVTPRRYTKPEAGSVREALREIYDCLNGKAAPIVANYDGSATLFTREWTAIIQTDGPQSAVTTLDAIRSQIRTVHTELQAILDRRPYFGEDMRSLINDKGETGEMNGALNNYINALQHLPNRPAVDLIKLAIGPSQSDLVKAMEIYTQWIAAFNAKVILLKGGLEFLME